MSGTNVDPIVIYDSDDDIPVGAKAEDEGDITLGEDSDSEGDSDSEDDEEEWLCDRCGGTITEDDAMYDCMKRRFLCGFIYFLSLGGEDVMSLTGCALEVMENRHHQAVKEAEAALPGEKPRDFREEDAGLEPVSSNPEGRGGCEVCGPHWCMCMP